MQPARSEDKPGDRRLISVRGKLEDYKRSRMEGTSDDNSLVIRLELKDGKGCLVDLGEVTKMSDLDLDRGDRVIFATALA